MACGLVLGARGEGVLAAASYTAEVYLADLSAQVRGECELDEIRSEILDPLRLAARQSLAD